VNLNELSVSLNYLGIKELNIFCIDEFEAVNKILIEGPSSVVLAEVGKQNFIELINNTDLNFYQYNKHSLYIIRNGSVLDIKTLFDKLANCEASVGKGGGQKGNIVSTMELRFFSYLLAIFKLNFQKLYHSNGFESLIKDKYITY
jgi:hypothetical protein